MNDYFLTLALDGPVNCSGQNMRCGHGNLVARGLNDSHFDAVVPNLTGGEAAAKVTATLHIYERVQNIY